MRLSPFVILFILISILLASCAKKPRHVLSDKKMIALFQDLYLVDGIMRNRMADYQSDKQKDALINGVLSKHGVTQAELDSSLVWYADNIDAYTQIQDTVSARLEKRSELFNKLNASSYSYKLVGFSTELPEYFILDANTPTFRFKIDSTKLASFGSDKFRFGFDIQGVDTTLHNIETSIYYKYVDTTVVDKLKIGGDNFYVFEKPQLADSLLKEISAYVHLAMATNKMPKVLLNNIQNQDIKINKDSTKIITDRELLDEMSSKNAVR